MLKYFAICAALLTIGAGSANAQQQDAFVQKIVVPGAGFDIILVMPKPNAATLNLRGVPDPYIVYPVGDALAFAVDGEVEKMFKDVGSFQFPIAAFQVERPGSKGKDTVAVYIVPKTETRVSQ